MSRSFSLPLANILRAKSAICGSVPYKLKKVVEAAKIFPSTSAVIQSTVEKRSKTLGTPVVCMVVVAGGSEVVDISGLWGAVTGVGEREINIPVGGLIDMAVGEREIGIVSRVADCRWKLKMCGTRRGRNIGRFASICASTTYKSDFEGWLVNFEMINKPGVRRVINQKGLTYSNKSQKRKSDEHPTF